MSAITDEQLVAIEAAAKEATPGAWEYSAAYGAVIRRNISGPPLRIAEGDTVFDCEHVAAAHPSAVLSLIADLKQARAERDEARARETRLREACEAALRLIELMVASDPLAGAATAAGRAVGKLRAALKETGGDT